jgi:hypothetical protein
MTADPVSKIYGNRSSPNSLGSEPAERSSRSDCSPSHSAVPLPASPRTSRQARLVGRATSNDKMCGQVA